MNRLKPKTRNRLLKQEKAPKAAKNGTPPEPSLRLDLGCGSTPKEGFDGVDISPNAKAKYVHDLNKMPWPFHDNSVDEVFSSHLLEHIPGICPRDSRVNVVIGVLLDLPGIPKEKREQLTALLTPPPEGRIAFMDELYRIMKVGAKATIVVPYWANARAVQDPTHAWPSIAEPSFVYYNKGWREANNLTHYLGKCDFDFSYSYQVSADIGGRSREVQDDWIAHRLNTVMDLVVTLVKKDPVPVVVL
jgi:hypothetical protein